jgi:peptidoglycan/LPS O-acetylase OafA/YrhL
MIFVYVGMMVLQGFHIQDSLTYFVCLFSITLPSTIAFSHVLYNQVEKPGMDYARRLCKHISAVSTSA